MHCALDQIPVMEIEMETEHLLIYLCDVMTYISDAV